MGRPRGSAASRPQAARMMSNLDARRPQRGRRVALGLTALVLLAGVLASCAERTGREGLGVLNSTDVPVTFEYLYPGGTYEIPGATEPGERSLVIADNTLWAGLLGKDGCTTGTLIAKGPDGAEVARHGPGLCDTADWEVTRAVPSSSP
jgi:hypothetical protein